MGELNDTIYHYFVIDPTYYSRELLMTMAAAASGVAVNIKKIEEDL